MRHWVPGIAMLATASLLALASTVVAQTPMQLRADFGPGQPVDRLRTVVDELMVVVPGVVFRLDPATFGVLGFAATGADQGAVIEATPSWLFVDDGGTVLAFDRSDHLRYVTDLALPGFDAADPGADLVGVATPQDFALYDVSDPANPWMTDSVGLPLDPETYGPPGPVLGGGMGGGQAFVRRTYTVNIGDDMFPMFVNRVLHDVLDVSDPQQVALLASLQDENAPGPSTPLIADGIAYRFYSSIYEWQAWPTDQYPTPLHTWSQGAGGALLRAGPQHRMLVQYGTSGRIWLLASDLQPLCDAYASPPLDPDVVQATADHLVWPGSSGIDMRSFDCGQGLGPVETASVGIVAAHAAQRGTTAFVTDPDLWAIDLSDPRHVHALGRVAGVTGQPVPTQNDYVCLEMGGQIRILDVSDPGDITDYGVHDPGATILELASAGEFTVALYADQNNLAGLAVIDLGDPAAPTISGTFQAAAPWDPADLGTVAVHPSGHAYVGHRSDVVVVDVTNAQFPVEVTTFAAGNGVAPHRVFVENDRLWTSRSRDHSVFDLQDPSSPSFLGSVTLSDDTQPIDAIASIPGAVHVSAGNAIQTFAIDEPFALQEVAHHVRSSASGAVAARGDVVLSVDAGNGVQLLGLQSVTAAPTVASDGPHILEANWPNPFTASTLIRWRADSGPAANVRIYDLAGRLVRQWAGVPMGVGQLRWDGRDLHGREVASGVYLVRIRVGGLSDARRIVRLR